MTVGEIHAKLKTWDIITNPMPLNKFGALLMRRGYMPKCHHNGKRGYIVKIIENQVNKQNEAIRELLTGDSGDNTF